MLPKLVLTKFKCRLLAESVEPDRQLCGKSFDRLWGKTRP